MTRTDLRENRTAGAILINMLIAAVSLFVNGFGLYLTIRANIGAAPWDVLNLGISKTFGILYGTASIAVSVSILLIDILLKEPIGIAMFIDAIVVGKSVDFFNWIDPIPPCSSLLTGIPLLIAGLFVYLVMPFAAVMVQLGISRNREYLADETGGRTIRDPRALARALEHIERGEINYRKSSYSQRQNPKDPFSGQETPKNIYDCANMWISNPLKSGGLGSLFSTHPPMEERIRRLNELADKMGL